MINLRDYQSSAIDAFMSAKREGLTRLLIQLPTGTGKTVVFASIAKQLQVKTLIIAHRDELLRQAEDKVKMIWPGVKTGIVKAGENDYQNKDVVIASIQTISKSKRLNEIANENFKFCIIDESHHSCAKTYLDTISYLGFMDNNPGRLLLGVTATTKRLDKLGLDNVFQKIVFDMSIRTAVRAGRLSDLRCYKSETKTNLDSVKTSSGDFIGYQLAEAVNTSERNKEIIDLYLKHASGRKTIVFTAGIQHAHDLAKIFMDNGIEARALSGKTPADERKKILDDFHTGKINIVCNDSVLTEGYDEPSVSCIIPARPTKSETLYTQMIGRGTRTYVDKKDCLVLDIIDNRHDICTLASLEGLLIKDGESLLEADEEEREEKLKGTPTAKSKKLKLVEYDLLGRSKYKWLQSDDKWYLPVSPGVNVILIKTITDEEKWNVILSERDQKPQLVHPTPIDFGYAQGISEDYTDRHGEKTITSKKAKWLKDTPSDKQIETLKKLKIKYDSTWTKGQACEAISNFFIKKEIRKTRGILG